MIAIGAITADSRPDYHNGLPWDDYWNSDQWVIWHKRLKERYGQRKANDMVAEAWAKNGFWAIPRSFSKYNSSFVNYFKSQGMDTGHMVSKLVLASNDIAQGAATGIKTLARLSPVIIPAVVIGIGLVAWNAYGKPLMKSIKK